MGYHARGTLLGRSASPCQPVGNISRHPRCGTIKALVGLRLAGAGDHTLRNLATRTKCASRRKASGRPDLRSDGKRLVETPAAGNSCSRKREIEGVYRCQANIEGDLPEVRLIGLPLPLFPLFPLIKPCGIYAQLAGIAGIASRLSGGQTVPSFPQPQSLAPRKSGSFRQQPSRGYAQVLNIS